MAIKQTSSRCVRLAALVLLGSGTFVLAFSPSNHPGILATLTPEPTTVSTAQLKPVPQLPSLTDITGVNAGSAKVRARQLRAEDYQHDWSQAGEGNARLGQTTRHHRVRLGVDGALRGRISSISADGTLVPARNVMISLAGPNGDVRGFTGTGTNGEFVFPQSQPGVLGLIAEGPDGLIAFAVHVLPAKAEDAPGVLEFRLDATAIAAQDITLAKRIIEGHVPHGVDQLRWTEPRGEQIPPTALGGGNDQAVNAVSGSALTHHRLYLRTDGSLIGRIRVLHPASGRPLRPREMTAFVLRDGALVEESSVERNGTFTFESLQPGVYSFVTAGLDGFAVFSIHVLRQINAVGAKLNAHEFRGVALSSVAEDIELDVALVYPTALGVLLQVSPETLTEPCVDIPPQGGFMGSPGGFSGGGAGGGLGGGGGLGALIAAGLGGAAGYPLPDDDKQPLPATPIIP
jgi:hypothetical protein